MKLKTSEELLEHIDKVCLACKKDCDVCEGPCPIEYINYTDLKAEAIKWINYLKKWKKILEPTMTIEMMNAIEKNNLDNIAVVSWIKYFFNIDERDLK